ncbi:MAG: DUF4270 family protein [Chitinophagaceae bacterium]|nr:MAG: DUF4270 family protein [Chitinophagaceae bacterium]
MIQRPFQVDFINEFFHKIFIVFKRFLPISLLVFTTIAVGTWGCTKLDTTTLGSDLIPAVDNITTFADTLDINTTQGIFNDSFKIARTDRHVLGLISNDPLFGSTDARIYMQPKPSFYPHYLGNATDSIIAIDSVVVTLLNTGTWGDTSVLQQLRVHEIDDVIFADSVYKKTQTISYAPTLGSLVGSASVNLARLNRFVKYNYGKDSVANQVRIKLSDAYRDKLFNNKDTGANALGNAFRSDFLFRKTFNGLAVSSTAGNAVMYINMTDANTHMEIYVRKKNMTTGSIDSTYNTFSMVASSSNIAYSTPSATANYVQRSHAPGVLNPAPGELYLQTGPGTFATLSIPGLSGLTNRIVHRAQIHVEQIPENQMMDSIFSVPPFMYLDLRDTGSTAKWKPVYFDLNPNLRYDPDNKSGLPYYPSSGEIEYSYFGGFARKRTNALGQKVWYYDINVTRYVQQIATKGTPNYEMRLFPGYTTMYPQYATATFPATTVPLDNQLAYGRIKVKSGNYPDPQKQVKMRMTIIWSKL